MLQGLSPAPPRQQMDIYIDPDMPAYKVIEKRGFFDDNDHLWSQGSMIYWEDEPNMGFEPLNDLAEEMMRDYLTKLDGKAQEVAKAKGMGHASLVNAFDAKQRLLELDRRFERSVDQEEELPIMRAKHFGKKKARSIHDVRPSTPMMGHKGRQSVAEKQSQRKKGLEDGKEKVD